MDTPAVATNALLNLTEGAPARFAGDGDIAAPFDLALKQELALAAEALVAAESPGMATPAPADPTAQATPAVIDPAALAALLGGAAAVQAETTIESPLAEGLPAVAGEAHASGAVGATADAPPLVAPVDVVSATAAALAVTPASTIAIAQMPQIAQQPAAAAPPDRPDWSARPALAPATAATTYQPAAAMPLAPAAAATPATAPVPALEPPSAGEEILRAVVLSPQVAQAGYAEPEAIGPAPTLRVESRREAAHRVRAAETPAADALASPFAAPAVEPLMMTHAAAAAPAIEAMAAFGERGATAESPMDPGPVVSAPDNLTSAAVASRWQPGVTPATEPPPAAATARVETPLGESGWSDAFNQKIVWLVDRQQQSAELYINPPQLGPVEVMLNFSDESASIAFASPHAAVREAIESSLAELRAALAEKGVALGESHVSADSGTAREQLAQQAQAAARARNAAAAAPVAETPLPELRPRPLASRGLVDLFA